MGMRGWLGGWLCGAAWVREAQLEVLGLEVGLRVYGVQGTIR